MPQTHEPIERRNRPSSCSPFAPLASLPVSIYLSIYLFICLSIYVCPVCLSSWVRFSATLSVRSVFVFIEMGSENNCLRETRALNLKRVALYRLQEYMAVPARAAPHI